MGVVRSVLDTGASHVIAATADTAANAFRKRWGIGVFDEERNRETAAHILARATGEYEAAQCLAAVVRERELMSATDEWNLTTWSRKLTGFYLSLEERCKTAERIGKHVKIDKDDIKEIGGCYEIFRRYHDLIEGMALVYEGEE